MQTWETLLPGKVQGWCRFANWNILWTLQWLQKCLRMTTAVASYPKKIRKLSRCPASALVPPAPARCPLSFLLRHDLEAWICPAPRPSRSLGWSSLSSAPEANAAGRPPPSAKLKEVRTAGYTLGPCFSALWREPEKPLGSPRPIASSLSSHPLPLPWGRQFLKALHPTVNDDIQNVLIVLLLAGKAPQSCLSEGVQDSSWKSLSVGLWSYVYLRKIWGLLFCFILFCNYCPACWKSCFPRKNKK